MLCQRCGSRIPDGAVRCPACRGVLAKKAEDAPQAVPQHEKEKQNDLKSVFVFFFFMLLVPAVLFYASFNDLPAYIMYLFLRLAVMFQSVIFTIMSFHDKTLGRFRYLLAGAYIVIAVVFCPLIKGHGMPKSSWKKWNISAAVMLTSGNLCFLYEMIRKNPSSK